MMFQFQSHYDEQAMKSKKKSDDSTSPKLPAKIPEEQWGWYAGFTKDRSKMLTLREYVSSPAVCELRELTLPQITELTISRIEVQPTLDINFLTATDHIRIDKEVALDHLRNRKTVAPFLRNIEKRILKELIARARNEINNK